MTEDPTPEPPDDNREKLSIPPSDWPEGTPLAVCSDVLGSAGEITAEQISDCLSELAFRATLQALRDKANKVKYTMEAAQKYFKEQDGVFWGITDPEFLSTAMAAFTSAAKILQPPNGARLPPEAYTLATKIIVNEIQRMLRELWTDPAVLRRHVSLFAPDYDLVKREHPHKAPPV